MRGPLLEKRRDALGCQRDEDLVIIEIRDAFDGSRASTRKVDPLAFHESEKRGIDLGWRYSGAVTARVDVGEGPTAAAVDNTHNRVYVLNRFTNSVALVSTTSLTKFGDLGMKDGDIPALLSG